MRDPEEALSTTTPDDARMTTTPGTRRGHAPVDEQNSDQGVPTGPTAEDLTKSDQETTLRSTAACRERAPR
ncbi:hypothetical protein ASG28_09245 [Frigoribacterium sp. Leaf415]|nr:hypothetical protein ASF07_09240 [Frigoribacterium sp. Leaf254]KQT39728.1 hypothetical protein ASG28_09245 [Frigoribacterium sp. Leaf415]